MVFIPTKDVVFVFTKAGSVFVNTTFVHPPEKQVSVAQRSTGDSPITMPASV